MRLLTNALLERIDDVQIEMIRKKHEFWPGGDLRYHGNQWLRSAFNKSALTKVPRENSVRRSLWDIIKKKRLRLQLRTHLLEQYACYIVLFVLKNGFAKLHVKALGDQLKTSRIG